VDYELTKLGSTLWEAVEPLGSWARDHVSEILRSRKRFDEDGAKSKSALTTNRTARA
jgi:DNA-binding HxlR family transcriptional regulator